MSLHRLPIAENTIIDIGGTPLNSEVDAGGLGD